MDTFYFKKTTRSVLNRSYLYRKFDNPVEITYFFVFFSKNDSNHGIIIVIKYLK